MQYEAATPAEYIAQLDDDWRRGTLLALRQVVKDAAPDLTEDMHYKMLGYAKGDDYVFHLNAQKGYVSLYVGNAGKIDPTGELLAGLNCGKGCIRFSKTKRIEDTGIVEFVTRAVAMWREGHDMGC